MTAMAFEYDYHPLLDVERSLPFFCYFPVTTIALWKLQAKNERHDPTGDGGGSNVTSTSTSTILVVVLLYRRSRSKIGNFLLLGTPTWLVSLLCRKEMQVQIGCGSCAKSTFAISRARVVVVETKNTSGQWVHLVITNFFRIKARAGRRRGNDNAHSHSESLCSSRIFWQTIICGFCSWMQTNCKRSHFPIFSQLPVST